MDKIKVLIVDDQTLMCDGLKTIIDLEDNMETVGVCKNGEECIKKCKEEKVDLVLMDIRMPIMNGVECTKILKNLYPHIKILILTTFDDDDYIIEGLS
ncbi:MAG: response regulator, partial [Clostridium sp.]